MQPATSLEDLDQTLSPQPLLSVAELEAFYEPQLNGVRGGDVVTRLNGNLNQAFAKKYCYKAFLMGHPGVGKSTELTRLVEKAHDRFMTIRFSANKEVDGINFKSFDVLLVMMAEIAERTVRPINKGGTGQQISDKLLQDIWDWFETETDTQTQALHKAGEISGGLGLPSGSWIAKTLGLFATLKGEIKYSADRDIKTVEYRFKRLSVLMTLTNRLLDECNALLRSTLNREWLFIGEDFEKPGIPQEQTQNFFLTYANIFKELNTHLIFTLPIYLGYGDRAGQLALARDCVLSLPDTPVFHPNHKPHEAGRKALRAVVEARAAANLFEDGQMDRLIVASGGNLRDLFSLIRQAADKALYGEPPRMRVNADDVEFAINAQRRDYRGRIGETLRTGAPIPYEDKAKRLVDLYNEDPNAQVPDAVLYSLLHSRAVQEFGDGTFGVHPLVVDLLGIQGRIGKFQKEIVAGGTE